jgi:transposase, IS6 family
MQCATCRSERFTTAGFNHQGRQIFRCTGCGRRQTERPSSAFSGYRFPNDIIALAVRWSLRFRLSYVDLVELLAERGISVDPSTVFDWVQHFTPLDQHAARPFRHRVGCRWAVDEPYIRMAGKWVYASRAIDEDGQVIDVSVSERRDTAAAPAFLRNAIESTRVRPETVTTDKAPTDPPAFEAGIPEAEHITGKLEQQGIERDHQHLKGRVGSMRGFHHLRCAPVIGQGHAVLRNLHRGFYRLAVPTGTPRLRQRPRLVRAWDELTVCLEVA